jgi:hypothetical protein
MFVRSCGSQIRGFVQRARRRYGWRAFVTDAYEHCRATVTKQIEAVAPPHGVAVILDLLLWGFSESAVRGTSDIRKHIGSDSSAGVVAAVLLFGMVLYGMDSSLLCMARREPYHGHHTATLLTDYMHSIGVDKLDAKLRCAGSVLKSGV